MRVHDDRVERAPSVLRRWAGAAATGVLLGALLGALRPPLYPGAWALRTLLLALPVVLLALAMAVVYPLRARIGLTTAKLTVRAVVGIVFLLAGGGVAVWATKFEYPYSLLSRRGLLLMGFFMTVVTIVSIGAAQLAARSRRLRAMGAYRIGAVAALALTLVFNDLGFILDLSPFWPLRYSNTLVLSALVLAAASLARRVGWLGRFSAIGGVASIAVALAVMATRTETQTHRAYGVVLADGGNSRRMIMLLRRLTDRDGNGYSARFNGGDCDESNPDAYPLGPADCSGLLRHARAVPAPAIAVPPVRRVLLLTIDTLRCQLDREDLCPDLDRLAPAASYRGMQRVFMAQTPRSLAALLGGRYVMDAHQMVIAPSYLVARARDAGYRTKAFYTIDILARPAMADAFEERDDWLGKGLSHPELFETVFSGRLTHRVIDDLAAHADDGRKSLVWVHYLDPHETYVPTGEGEPVPYFRFDRRGAYAVEVRRTQAAVARLIDRARSLGYDRDAAILVTGDHGEEFRTRRLYHGTAAGDDLDTPVYGWLFDAGGRQLPLPLAPRVFERDLAALLAALVGAPPPPGQTDVSIVDNREGDRQFVVTDGRFEFVYHQQLNYEELFDRTADPEFKHNLAYDDAEHLAQLRTLLSQQLYPFAPRETQALK